ncbi:hypothetical protein [Amycolatopsis sp. H20-H5]|uniref:hypothetical protein n=1 Tax=Amycolatopsis sp. H20-H5 TaxID=3046309 RepID=UPI002DBAF1F0|nr:hypothetical protein [Amycolatopsis sp. H20-H5]MEC3978197.1 hypothetical protein [Amycolatopsis sp. H20-H5]
MHLWDPINDRQLIVLKRLSAGESLSGAAETQARISARALTRRGLAEVSHPDGGWQMGITAAGSFYLEHGHHPDQPPSDRRGVRAHQPGSSANGLVELHPAPIDWDGKPLEHDGMLWKPEPGTSVTFDQFVQARLLVVEIHRDMAWNRWREDERAGELQDAMDVFAHWHRAEPDFRPMTAEEVAAWMDEEEASSKARIQEDERQRRARIPPYDAEREQARLSLLECEASLRSSSKEREGLADGSLFPAMDAQRRDSQIKEAEAAVVSQQARMDQLRQVVGDLETVVDSEGRLPCDRREFHLSRFSWWRGDEVRRLRALDLEFQEKLADATDRSARAQLRTDRSRAEQQREALEVMPSLDAAAMCSECASPMNWHQGSWPIHLQMGPCPAWPNWAARVKKAREMLLQDHDQRAKTAPRPKPIAVVPSGLPIAEIVAKLAEIQVKHPDAIVRRGAANRWEVWPPRNKKS